MAVNNNILYSNSSGNVGVCLGNNNPVCRMSLGVGLGEYTGYGITYTGSPTEVKAGILVCADTGAVNIGGLNSSGTWYTTIRSNNFPVATFNDNTNTPNLFCRRDFDPTGASPVTCYCKVAEFFGRDVNISSGKLDCGYRVGLVTETYFDEAVFAGTLRQSIGVWARVGTYGSLPTGTICCAMAVDVDTLKGSNSTIHNLYGIYQHGSTGTKNYFQHCIGIGTPSPAGLLSFEKGIRTLDIKLEDSPATGDVGVQFRAGSGDYFGIAAGGGSGVGIVVTDANNVGIGTISPTGQLSVCNSCDVNTCIQIKNKCTGRYSYLQLENDNGTHQYHLGIGNTAVPNVAVRGKFYLFANASSKSLLEIDSSGRAKFQTSVGSGGANASATWHTETSGLQLVGPCACTLSRFMITAVDPASTPDACAVYASLSMGHWDNSRVLLESSGKQMMITSYDEGIALGNDGNAELCIGTLGDVIIKPTTAKTADPLGILCLDITGSTNPQNGGIVMNSTSQTHIRFLSGGNLCWQWRHHSPAACDVFSVYSWKRGCDMFMIKAPIDTDTGFTSFGPYGHIISCAPIYIANTLDPYFINSSGNKCMNFYYYAWPGCSCFGQTHLMARFDRPETNVCQVYPTVTLYNANTTEGTSSTLAFAGRETGGGNSIGLAYISGKKESSMPGSWGCGSLQFLVNCGGQQCWTMCMTMHGGVCVIKCLVAPNIQMVNSNCILCLAAAGSGGPYLQGSTDCTVSYWGVNNTWKASINSTGGFCAANCVMSPLNCGTLTCACVYRGCTTGAAGATMLFLGRTNSTDCHYLNVVVNADDNLVTLCSSGTNAGGFCMWSYVVSPCMCALGIKAADCLCTSGALITCQTGAGCGIVACLTRANGADNHHLSIAVNPDNNCVIYTSSGASAGLHCFTNPVEANCLCGVDCIKSPVLCASTAVRAFGFCSYGVGCDSGGPTRAGGTGNSYIWGYQRGGTWTGNDYPDLVIGYHTGVEIGGYFSYGGTRFYNDHPSRTDTKLIFMVGCGNCNVCACYNLCAAAGVYSPIICATSTMQVGGNDVLTTASNVGANFCAGTDVNNRVVTANGASGSLCGEANMTFDGSTLNVTGAITASGDITSTSDERVKREIAAICGAIQIVNNLCGRIFIKDNRQQVGVIAQEVEKVLPQVVFEHNNNDLKSVSYGNIVGVLIEAIKDQDKRIDELEKMIQDIQ